MKNLSFILILFIALTLNTFAQNELDTSFGGSGAFTLSQASGGIGDVVIQPDDKTLSLGSCRTVDAIAYPVCLVRLNQNGSLDSSFGGGSGYVFTTISAISFTPTGGSFAFVLQDDGKIVVLAAEISSSNFQAFLIRYNTDGSIDTGFGNNGFKMMNIGRSISGLRMLIQPDQKLVISGTMSDNKVFVGRYLSDGTPDNTFGNNGVFNLFQKGFFTYGNTIKLRNDGKLIFGGSRTAGKTSTALLGQINSNGTLDQTFGESGIKLIEDISSINRLSIQGDYRIVALASQNLIYRFTPNGEIDTSFNSTGSRSVFRSPNADSTNDLAVTPSGKVTVVGRQLSTNSPINYLVARFTRDGEPDTTFSGDGLYEIDILPVDSPSKIVFDRNAKAVIAGLSAFGTVGNPFENPRFSIARLAASPVQSVQFSGRIIATNGRAVFNASVLLKDGSNIVGYARTNPFGYFRFYNVQSSQTYTISINIRGKTFAEQEVLIDDTLENYRLVID